MRTRTRCLWLLVALVSLPVLPAQATDARETPIVRAVKRAKQSVVNIHSEKTARDRDSVFDGGTARKVNGMGTGIIVDERGYIVTNQHVIADVESLRVTLLDGSTYNATIVSYDKRHDLAIIKIDARRPLPVLPLGTSCDLMLGETVIAVGNAFGYEHTITSGIISALHRDVEVNETQSYQNLIQTDASINPGNSGGPLVNLDGEVIGINVAIRAGAQRIGFAIPIDDARKLVAKLLSTRKLEETWHGLITRDEKDPQTKKLIVEKTETNSPAMQAGFQPGDVIVQSGPVKINDGADLERSLLGHRVGEPVDVTVRRDNETVILQIQMARDTTVVRTASVRTPVPQANTAEDRSWSVLGVRLVRLPSTHVTSVSQFRGGMKVVEIRDNSPAARGGLKAGDVLVGLHEWETVKSEDVLYVVNHSQLTTFSPMKFLILRSGKTMEGKMKF